MSNNKHLIARLVTEITCQECIEHGMYAACLPTSLIIFEQLQTFQPEIKCGMMVFGNVLPIPIHIWCEIDGIKYDTTQKLCLHYLSEKDKADLEGKTYEYFPGNEIISCAEDQEILNFYNIIKITKNVQPYFEAAPFMVKSIRNKVNLRARKLFKNSK